jgi:hypothetical protein
VTLDGEMFEIVGTGLLLDAANSPASMRPPKNIFSRDGFVGSNGPAWGLTEEPRNSPDPVLAINAPAIAISSATPATTRRRAGRGLAALCKRLRVFTKASLRNEDRLFPKAVQFTSLAAFLSPIALSSFS